ncbi:ATP-binding protein [Ramlibacter pallidus]|uniref:SEC-C domain-containing protein n=1 Tax=Ramlibacter pallidus TaxID=2780087 RepID=A0ABR9S5T3_9BURK|nr:ATP-binding protein [Ramlibacter pallidus]MBE7368875.1 SEC-C domain-containing protein [Ramlibacter pallidus]
MYQHLFAAGCLLSAQGSDLRAIRVELDEDIELQFSSLAVYVQVKTRNRPLIQSDIGDALERFATLRQEHISGRRAGDAQFVVVSNQPPGEVLARALAERDLNYDSLEWPGGRIGPQAPGLPPAWRDIASAVAWCTTAAEQLPLRTIAAETLVWKLAANVALASSGTWPYGDHQFLAEGLPALFEQFARQLHDFPELLLHYRPHQNEPAIESTEYVRVVCGFSGAGKTSWAAQTAAHSGNACAYYDAGDTAPAALPSALVRECAAQLAGSMALERVLLPGASGLESLRALDQALQEKGSSPILVIDNAHALPSTALEQVARNTSSIRLVLLGHPGRTVAELEALQGIRREDLRGWSVEDVAAEAAALGCIGTIEGMEHLRVLTGGYPLFVQSAARLAASEHNGSIDDFVHSLERGLHGAVTAQEVILERVFDSLPLQQQQAACALSFSEVPLSRAEMLKLLRACLDMDEVGAASVVRQLKILGLAQSVGGDRARIHDAVRTFGKIRSSDLPVLEARALQELSEIILQSLQEHRDFGRIVFWARLLSARNHLEPLIELMGEEIFHEMGVIPEVSFALEQALASGRLEPEQQFWAYDGLIFSALKHGVREQADKIVEWLAACERVVEQFGLSPTHRARLWMKRMNLAGVLRDEDGVMAALEQASRDMPDLKGHQRILAYNAAAALFSIGSHHVAEQVVSGVIDEYYEVLGISPEQVMGLRQAELWEAIDKPSLDIDDVKHLADALELLAKIGRKTGQRVPLARIHAMRFYEIAGALDSYVRAGLDVADDFVWVNDFLGARNIMEDFVLPFIQRHSMVGKMLDARSLYAVILAYSGEFDNAESEMRRLEPLIEGAPAPMQTQLAAQKRLIAEIREKGPPPQRRLPERAGAAPFAARVAPIVRQSAKVGRNDPCPCGSGLKFKKCHGV